MKRIRGTWKGNVIALLLCAAFFGLFALLAQVGGIPEYGELEAVSGTFAGMEHRIRKSTRGADREWWEIAFDDGTTFQVDDVIRFDAKSYMERVQVGDALIVLAAPDGDGWNLPYEIRLGDEVVHSYETSAAGIKENQRTALILPLVFLLCAALVWPVKMIQRKLKERGQK